MLLLPPNVIFINLPCTLNAQKTLRAGKLTEKILKLFTATGNEEILRFVQSLNIKQVLTPVLPTSK